MGGLDDGFDFRVGQEADVLHGRSPVAGRHRDLDQITASAEFLPHRFTKGIRTIEFPSQPVMTEFHEPGAVFTVFLGSRHHEFMGASEYAGTLHQAHRDRLLEAHIQIVPIARPDDRGEPTFESRPGIVGRQHAVQARRGFEAEHRRGDPGAEGSETAMEMGRDHARKQRATGEIDVPVPSSSRWRPALFYADESGSLDHDADAVERLSSIDEASPGEYGSRALCHGGLLSDRPALPVSKPGA